MIPNPACKVGCGEWKRPTIKNPAYKGDWKAPLIDNPEYKVCDCGGGELPAWGGVLISCWLGACLLAGWLSTTACLAGMDANMPNPPGLIPEP